jgi:hypothetical protein
MTRPVVPRSFVRGRGAGCVCVLGESAVRGFWEDESIRVTIIGAQRAQGTPWQMSAPARTLTGSLEVPGHAFMQLRGSI